MGQQNKTTAATLLKRLAAIDTRVASFAASISRSGTKHYLVESQHAAAGTRVYKLARIVQERNNQYPILAFNWGPQ
jgi:hypothetical protein